MADDSLQVYPVIFIAIVLEPYLLRKANPTITNIGIKLVKFPRTSMFAFNPENVKNRGSKIATVMSFNLLSNPFENTGSRGTAKPKMNPPNTEYNPQS